MKEKFIKWLMKNHNFRRDVFKIMVDKKNIISWDACDYKLKKDKWNKINFSFCLLDKNPGFSIEDVIINTEKVK